MWVTIVSHLPIVLNIVCNPCDIFKHLSTIIFILFFHAYERNIFIWILIYIHTFGNKKQAEFCFSNKLKTPYSYRKFLLIFLTTHACPLTILSSSAWISNNLGVNKNKRNSNFTNLRLTLVSSSPISVSF